MRAINQGLGRYRIGFPFLPLVGRKPAAGPSNMRAWIAKTRAGPGVAAGVSGRNHPTPRFKTLFPNRGEADAAQRHYGVPGGGPNRTSPAIIAAVSRAASAPASRRMYSATKANASAFGTSLR